MRDARLEQAAGLAIVYDGFFAVPAEMWQSAFLHQFVLGQTYGARTCLILIVGAGDEPRRPYLNFQADHGSAIPFRVLQLTDH